MGDITITSKRSKYSDFALPFSSGGVTITVPITYKDPNNKWFNKAYRGSRSQHLGMIFYFPFTSLVYPQGERIASNMARLVVIVWLFGVLILNSIYRASLSARFTAQRLQPAVTDVKNLIRNGGYVGCHRASFIYERLQYLGFDSKIRTYMYPEDIDEALTKGSAKGGISVLFSVMLYTKLYLSNVTSIQRTDRRILLRDLVFQKGSPLVADVSRAVTGLTENGRTSEIEGQWIKYRPCNVPDGDKSASISLKSFQMLFGITAGITTTGVLVFLVKLLYKKRTDVRENWNKGTTVWSKLFALGEEFDKKDTNSLQPSEPKESEQNASTGLTGSSRSSSVVPVSSDEIGDAIKPRTQNMVLLLTK